ncbi:MAG: GNAT family N-acetyltransferase [Dehalococcoidia bacterium]|jgi:ribosomal-protein-alanine N-acetyltransferase
MPGWLLEPLHTQRLYLRPTRPGDEDWIIKLFTDEEVRRYLGGALSEAEARDTIKITGEKWGHFDVVERESNDAIGSLSFARKSSFWEISYQLQRNFWGKGIVGEAIKAALSWFFGETDVENVFAVTQTDNERSCRLLEKLGAEYVNSYEYKNAPQSRYVFFRDKCGISTP